MRERLASLESSVSSVDKARILASDVIDRRLDGMNELRRQIDKERGSYITRETYEKDFNAAKDRIILLEKSNVGLFATVSAYAGMGAFLISATALAIAYFRH